jgi:UDPglucose 6-dehydrogenase
MDEARRIFQGEDRIEYCARPMDVLPGAEALIIVTEWKEFRSPDFSVIKAMLKQPVIFDGRNMYHPETLAECGIEYHPIGRKAV